MPDVGPVRESTNVRAVSILGVPVLTRYDLLEKLLESTEAGVLKPTEYLIVDNGGKFAEIADDLPGVVAARARGARIWLLEPGANLGVAASWNAILERVMGPVTIVNDDVVLGPETLAILADAITRYDFVIADGGWNANGWCCFAQSPRCVKTIGYYDESFYPAYFEDRDYERRLWRAGIVPMKVPVRLTHKGQATMNAEGENGHIRQGYRKSAEYFERKWGKTLPMFQEPFDGAPINWSIRKGPHVWRELARADSVL